MFNLESIRRGKGMKPPRIFLYSVEGLGKSTFGAGAPKPIFIPTEDGLGNLDVASFPLVQSTDQVREALTTLYEEKHDFETAVIDSADWLDAIITRELEEKFDQKELGYGRGALKQAEIWRELLEGFNALRNDKGMAIIILGHVQIKRFDSPETDPFDRYQPKISERSNALIREWADCVLFANYKTIVKEKEVGFDKKVARGISTGERLMYTTEKPAYMAKNRYGLPESLPLSWDALAEAIEESSK